MTQPIVIIRPHPVEPAAGNPQPAPAAPATIPFDKMSFAQQRLAQDQAAAAAKQR